MLALCCCFLCKHVIAVSFLFKILPVLVNVELVAAAFNYFKYENKLTVNKLFSENTSCFQIFS